MPPLTDSRNLLQDSEPYDRNDDGYNLYSTFVRRDGVWVYAGTCRRGKTQNEEGYGTRALW